MMTAASNITNEADTLLDLLIGQCEDLESLLALARAETNAAAANDFESLINTTRERATIGERLEVFHRQTAELRQRLGAAAETILQTPTAMRVTELINHILTQDEQTKPLLLAMRTTTNDERKNLDRLQRGLAAYHSEARMPAIACDQLA